MLWFCQSKKLFMTPFLHVACNRQIVLTGKWPAQSFIIYDIFTETEMTCAIPNKYLDLLKVKQKVCYIIPPCKHTIKGGMEGLSVFLPLLDMCYFYKCGITSPQHSRISVTPWEVITKKSWGVKNNQCYFLYVHSSFREFRIHIFHFCSTFATAGNWFLYF